MLPPKSSSRLRRIAGDAPEARERPANLRHDLVAQLWDGEDDDRANEERDADPDEEAPVGPGAVELARVELDVDEGEGDEEERHLHDRLRHVVDGARGERLPVGTPIRWRKRRFMPMRPAELGTVRLMNLIADCSTTHGSSGSGAAPRRALRCRIR